MENKRKGGRRGPGKLYRKIFFGFLAVSLPPLFFIYLYIISPYSENLRMDGIKQNQVTEKNAGMMAEEFLTKIEYISNLFFDANIQSAIKGADDPLGVYYAQTMLERTVRVNLDLFHILNYVDQVTFVKGDNTCFHVMNAQGNGQPVDFTNMAPVPVHTYKNHVLLRLQDLTGEDGGKLVYVRHINETGGEHGELGNLFIVFDQSNLDRMFADIGQVLNTRVVLKDGNGELLYANFTPVHPALNRMEEEAVPLTPGAEGIGKAELLSWKYPLEDLSLELYFYDDMESIEAGLKSLSRIAENSILVSVLVILLISLFFAKTIVKPITRLRHDILSVRSGDYKVRAVAVTNDELGELCMAFNDMAAEIDRLVNRVYAIQLRENEASIAALQSQINPHFLYNTLDMIKSMAEIYGAYQVSEVIMALSGIFRYAVHTDNFLVRVKDELGNLCNYMLIVNARFGGSIRYEASVRPEFLEEPIIKVCLQPIVENAISHGLGRGGKGGSIGVRLDKANDDIYITVTDDGAGIGRDRLEEIRKRLSLPPGESGTALYASVGLKNIHDRIRLYYGMEYGISIESCEGAGTSVTVRYPSSDKCKEIRRF